MSSEHEPRSETPPAVPRTDWRFSRRGFLRGVAVTAGAAAVSVGEDASAQAGSGSTPVGPGPVPVVLNVNGQDRRLNLEPRVTLLDALRNFLDLTGAKNVGDYSGADTVHVDGKPVYAGLMLALDAQGRKIVTVESLAGDKVPAAFVKHDAQQCGFCTPGFVMACKSLLNRTPTPTLDQIRYGLGGNVCRCGTYVGIIAAVQDAAGKGG
jgi:aerobic-type carbon monoxide dehydrogenase small subunit (CoxS/CutS family)